MPGERLDRYKTHSIELVIDRLVVKEEMRDRMMRSIADAMNQGKGTMALHDYSDDSMRYYSRHLMCPTTGVAFEDPEPYTFSFNSPKGACPHCNGLGEEAVFDMEKVLPDKSTLAYLIAPPLESMYAMDAALKAADVKLCKLYPPPSPTNFGGGLLTGTQSACHAACEAFAAAVSAVAQEPKGGNYGI